MDSTSTIKSNTCACKMNAHTHTRSLARSGREGGTCRQAQPHVQDCSFVNTFTHRCIQAYMNMCTT